MVIYLYHGPFDVTSWFGWRDWWFGNTCIRQTMAMNRFAIRDLDCGTKMHWLYHKCNRCTMQMSCISVWKIINVSTIPRLYSISRIVPRIVELNAFFFNSTFWLVKYYLNLLHCCVYLAFAYSQILGDALLELP